MEGICDLYGEGENGQATGLPRSNTIKDVFSPVSRRPSVPLCGTSAHRPPGGRRAPPRTLHLCGTPDGRPRHRGFPWDLPSDGMLPHIAHEKVQVWDSRACQTGVCRIVSHRRNTLRPDPQGQHRTWPRCCWPGAGQLPALSTASIWGAAPRESPGVHLQT